ncbi:MAG: ParB/RepB/Spo0J family partition protein [Bacteroidetes bacterium]|nr:ParB/RepB/Spo0J family partition protein [Bacteroidota bacterium]
MAKSKGKGSPEPQDELAELLRKNAAPPAAPVKQSTPSAEEPRFERIPLNRIKPSPTNPRTTFDEKKTQELSESIKVHGVLQPVLVRPYGQPGWYQLVYGQRREKASLMAGLTHIPALVRDLTDDQVIEIQITENLQREDVKPIEEANAYKNLMEIKGYDIRELSERVGKTPAFIAQRLKLNDLVDEFQKAMFEDRLTIVDALKVAKLRAEDQKDLWKEEEMEEGEIHVRDYMLRKYMYDLNNAPFDTTDATILPGMKACTTCSFNTACTTALFAEPEHKAHCSYAECFKKKTTVYYDRELQKCIEDSTITLVATYGSDSKKIAELRAKGISILDPYTYEEIYHPGPFDPDLEITEKSSRADIADYEDQKAYYEKEVQEYNEDIKTAIKAFVAFGNEKGKYIYIKPHKGRSGAKAAAQNTNASNEFRAAEIKENIQRIKDKEARQQDLDFFKVAPDAYKLLTDAKIHEGSKESLNALELAAAIIELAGYSHERDVIKYLKAPSSVHGSIPLYNWLKARSAESLTEALNLVLRLRLNKYLRPESEQTMHRHTNVLAMMDQVKAHFPDKYNVIMTALDDKKTKRAGKVKSAIDELQDQLKEIQGSKTDRVVKASKSKMGGGKTIVNVIIAGSC